MEFRFNAHNVVIDEVLKIDKTLIARGHETNAELKNKIGIIINEMGKASAVAQQLNSPITSANKLINSDHVIYIMTEHNMQGHFNVFGILKLGLKKLNLYDQTNSRTEAMVYCLLDFYIHETKQRNGYGKHLFCYMLNDMDLKPHHLAIDTPTKNVLNFMKKHFQLFNLVNHGNNFVIFKEFFDDAFNEKNHRVDTENRSAEYKIQPGVGQRHEAHKHHDTMGEIVQGQGQDNDSCVKYTDNTFVHHNQFQELQPHPNSVDIFKAENDGKSERHGLKHNHSTIW